MTPFQLFGYILSACCALAVGLLLVGFACLLIVSSWFVLIAPKQDHEGKE